MIPTSPWGLLLYTGAYALICGAIFLRVLLAARQGGPHHRGCTLLARLICLAAGSVPLRLLVGGIAVPDPATVALAACLLCVLLKSRGSVQPLLPGRTAHSTPTPAEVT